MRRARTDFPRVQGLPHLAPVFGALPIPGVSQMPTGTTMADEAVQQPEVLNATGVPQTLQPGGLVQPARAPMAEVLLGIGTASLSGAVIGGVSASSWRGASIGAGVSSGLWAGFTLLGGLADLPRSSKVALGLTAAGGLATAALLVMTRGGSK